MRVKVYVEIGESTVVEGGWLDWDIPVLPKVGDVVMGELLAQAFTPSEVYACLDGEEKELWNKLKNQIQTCAESDGDAQKLCCKAWFEEHDGYTVKEVAWLYSEKVGIHPWLFVEEDK